MESLSAAAVERGTVVLLFRYGQREGGLREYRGLTDITRRKKMHRLYGRRHAGREIAVSRGERRGKEQNRRLLSCSLLFSRMIHVEQSRGLNELGTGRYADYGIKTIEKLLCASNG